MSSVVARRKSRAFNNRIVWRKAVRGARRDGTSLEAELNRVVSKYAAIADSAPVDVEAMGKTLHALPSDTVLRTDADFDAFEREVLGDD